MGDKITKFYAVRIPPEEYDYYPNYSIVKKVKDDTSKVLYYARFRYLNRPGYRFFVFTKEFFEDETVDKIHFMKNECLEWAQANYGEGG